MLNPPNNTKKKIGIPSNTKRKIFSTWVSPSVHSGSFIVIPPNIIIRLILRKITGKQPFV